MVGGRIEKVEGEVMEIMTISFLASMVANVVLLYLWNKELNDHIKTLVLSRALMTMLNNTIKDLKEALEGGVSNETD